MDLGKKMKSFVKQYVAVVKGDDAEAQGEKVFRQADSALQTHIANLKGDTISLEDNVTNAKEELNLARVNNGQIILTAKRLGSQAKPTAYDLPLKLKK